MDYSDTDHIVRIPTATVDTAADATATYLAEAIDRAVDPNSPTAEDERFAILVAVILTLMLRLLLLDPESGHANLEQFYAQLKANFSDYLRTGTLH